MNDDKNADFSFFISSLAMQASIGLGIITSPITNKHEKNVEHAKLIVDTLDMLKEKTQGNLTIEEDSLLDKLLFELKKKLGDENKKEAA